MKKRRIKPRAKTLLQRAVDALERLSPIPTFAQRRRVRSYLGGHRWNR